jgi:hypothetical protein
LAVGQVCWSQGAPPASSAPAEQSGKAEKKKRMFGLMPEYGVVDPGAQLPPLTPAQKFKLAAQYLDPYTFGFIAVDAGIEQALNSPKEYGQGAAGFGKRYGANFTDGLTNSIFSTGVYPSLLHQDPRFYRRGDGPFTSRVSYAISRVLATRQDSGRPAFNFSEILGNLSSGAVSMSYYPDSQRSFADLAQRAGVQLGFDAGFDVLKEFYPDIARKVFRRKDKSQSPPKANAEKPN